MPDELTVAVEVSLGDRSASIAKVLGVESRDADDFEVRLGLLAQLAVEEFIAWAAAEQRFESPSQLDRHRLLQIYGGVRKEAPTIKSLVEDFAVSESRASSLLSRMNYGDARVIRSLMFKSAVAELQSQLATASTSGERKHVWVNRETGRLIEDANTRIMLDQEARTSGGAYEGAEKAEREETTRSGQLWSASDRMWELITTVLTELADA